MVDQEAHANREQKRADRQKRTGEKATVHRGIKLGDPEYRKQMRDQWAMLEVKDFDLRTATQFFTTAQ